jgi:hypothetical protein
LHPSEVAFLLDDPSHLRPNLPRDRASLEALREGGRQLLWGFASKTAKELLTDYGQEALALFQQSHPNELPSWWGMLSDTEKQILKI